MRLCLIATALLSAFAASATTIDSLPLLPQDEAVQNRDWLVHPIKAQAAVYRTADGLDLVLSNGLLRRTFHLAPNAATTGFDLLATGEALLRGVKPEARIEIDGAAYDVGGLTGQPNYAFLRPEWIAQLQADPKAMQFTGFETGETRERMAWAQVRHHAPGVAWPPKGVYLRMDYAMPESGPKGITVSVHYELYDGIPLLSKWITLQNDSQSPIVLHRFTSEILAAVEYGSHVETGGRPFGVPKIHVECDYAFNGMDSRDSSRFAVHWTTDPDYTSQVNYALQTPCLLEVRPEMGPEETVQPGETFTSFRAYVLPFDSDDRERNGLAQRRMYRIIAPWATENPLMMHVRYADWDTVKAAIDQCAEVGFEMVILTFGSGFDVEDDRPENIEKMTQYADYARGKGIEIGGYSLLASRSIDKENDVLLDKGESPVFGHSPCLESPWGQAYFDKLYRFYGATGFTLLEHDGSYPGDPCRSKKHPGHTGYEDSRWKQWREITVFYRWCREKGVYLNVPDFYFLAGSNKTGMGYREVNWSLPRAQQVIHTRQNIYDGTWQKLPSMGWMFVPLTEYHGGGEAATIEPLEEHLDHYRAMLMSNLASRRSGLLPRTPPLRHAPHPGHAQGMRRLVQGIPRHPGKRPHPRPPGRCTRARLDAPCQSPTRTQRPLGGLQSPRNPHRRHPPCQPLLHRSRHHRANPSRRRSRRGIHPCPGLQRPTPRRCPAAKLHLVRHPIAPSPAQLLQPMLLELVANLIPREPEKFGGLSLIAARALQGLLQEGTFDIRQPAALRGQGA